MEFAYLSEAVKIRTVSETATSGVFEVEGLYAGYGLTVGNALRRVLLSSLPGAAVTKLKIQNVPHEFTTLEGVAEDMVEFSLGFKRLRFQLHTEEPQVLTIDVKGERVVTGKDIVLNSQVSIVNPEEVLAHMTTKSAELHIELTVERGLGYWPVEARKSQEKLPVGAIAIDALFSPVHKVNFIVENMRVGDRTDYNRLRLEIETDGTISPSSALKKSGHILRDHFDKVITIEAKEFEVEGKPAAVTKTKKKEKEEKEEKGK